MQNLSGSYIYLDKNLNLLFLRALSASAHRPHSRQSLIFLPFAPFKRRSFHRILIRRTSVRARRVERLEDHHRLSLLPKNEIPCKWPGNNNKEDACAAPLKCRGRLRVIAFPVPQLLFQRFLSLFSLLSAIEMRERRVRFFVVKHRQS